jgi:hypothetical protein
MKTRREFFSAFTGAAVGVAMAPVAASTPEAVTPKDIKVTLTLDGKELARQIIQQMKLQAL